MASLFAIMNVLNFTLKFLLVGRLNISYEFVFWILSGFIFGPIKGMFFSIMADTFLQMMNGGIAFWMIEYAIVPPMVSIFSFMLFWLFEESKLLKSNNRKFAGTFFLFIISLLTFLSIHLIFIKDLEAIYLYMIYSLFIVYFIYFTISFFWFQNTNSKLIIKTLIYVSIIFFIMVLWRWLWGSFAFIQFFKRFISSNTTKNFGVVLITTIAYKSLFVIPLFTLTTIHLKEILTSLKKRHVNKTY